LLIPKPLCHRAGIKSGCNCRYPPELGHLFPD
jgi:hypothetical protein